jgi:hypothetical protein
MKPAKSGFFLLYVIMVFMASLRKMTNEQAQKTYPLRHFSICANYLLLSNPQIGYNKHHCK